MEWSEFKKRNIVNELLWYFTHYLEKVPYFTVEVAERYGSKGKTDEVEAKIYSLLNTYKNSDNL